MSRQPKCQGLLLEVTQERAVAKFVVKQGEATFEARFVSPAFGLLQPVHEGLYQNMLGQLATHGLRLNDIRFESAPAILAEAHSSYSINTLGVLVRVWLDRLEISFLDLARVTQEQILEIAGAALDAVQQTVADLAIDTYTLALAMHGSFQDVSLSQFVAQYVKPAPEALGSVLGSGVVYYLGPEEERRSASFVIDVSAVVSDAAFIRTSVILEGTAVAMSNAASMVRDEVFKILNAVDIEINGG
jgi:hypothetical protein